MIVSNEKHGVIFSLPLFFLVREKNKKENNIVLQKVTKSHLIV